jgi:hypothetical protein
MSSNSRFLITLLVCLTGCFISGFSQDNNTILLKNMETERYAFMTGDAFKGEPTNSWLGSPVVVGTDKNYYGRAKWELIPIANTPNFLIRNISMNRYLMCPGEYIRRADGQDEGWLTSKAILGSDANYYRRAEWKFTAIEFGGKSGYVLSNVASNRLLFSTGKKPVGDEGGWLKSPVLLGADANYYNRAIWFISGKGKNLLTAEKTAPVPNDDILLSRISEDILPTKYWYNIEAESLNQVIDIEGSNKADKTNISLYPKHSNPDFTNQHFKFVSKGNGVYEIHTRLNPNSLITDSSGKGTKGANVYLSTSNNPFINRKSQQFEILQDRDGYTYFKSILARDSYLGWKKTGNSYNLEIVKYTGKGSEKSIQFDLNQWRKLDLSEDTHIVNYDNISKGEDIKGNVNPNVLKYDVTSYEPIAMQAADGYEMGKIRFNFTPEVIKTKTGWLYVSLLLDGNTNNRIELSQQYINKKREQGFYLKYLYITMTATNENNAFQLQRDEPKNINSEGNVTTSETTTLSITGSADSGGSSGSTGLSYSWGYSFNRSVKDFSFANRSNGERPAFEWKLSGTKAGEYENYRSLGVGGGILERYNSLIEPPTLSRTTFPIGCGVLFRQRLNSVNMDQPIKVTINVQATFEKCWLEELSAMTPGSIGNNVFGTIAGLLSGESMAYRLLHVEQTTGNNIELNLDVSQLK